MGVPCSVKELISLYKNYGLGLKKCNTGAEQVENYLPLVKYSSLTA